MGAVVANRQWISNAILRHFSFFALFPARFSKFTMSDNMSKRFFVNVQYGYQKTQILMLISNPLKT
jgi:hypothetical protein